MGRKEKVITKKNVSEASLIRISCGVNQPVITEEDLEEASVDFLIVNKRVEPQVYQQARIYIITEGKGLIAVNKEHHEIKKGDAVAIRPEVLHDIIPDKLAGLVTWVITVPARRIKDV